MLTEQQYTELVAKLGKESGDAIKAEFAKAETNINNMFAEHKKGTISAESFEDYKKEQAQKATDLMKQLSTVEEANKEQGIKLSQILDNQNQVKGKSIDEFFVGIAPQLKKLQEEGRGFVSVTGAELKAAGVTSIGGTVIAPGSTPVNPYAPGISGTPLELFDIVRNPNFIINRVGMGNTNSPRLAWINEVDYQGTPNTNVQEAGTKPLTQHKFQVAYSDAKKAAAYIHLTEEFDQDLPELSAQVKNLLQQDVIRAFDDQLQVDIQSKARPFQITGLNGEIQAANYWDALFAMLIQIGSYNFDPNTIALSWMTDGRVEMSKNVNNTYLLPPFQGRIDAMKVLASKMATGYALAGDLLQYQVRMYKDFIFKMGWINDDLITNQFCIVGELRYHSYISDNRRNALCYDYLNSIAQKITGTPGS